MHNQKAATAVFEFMKAHNMVAADDNIIIGFSGGADSVCLLFILNLLKKEVPEFASLNLHAVHLNHGIRGAEAKRDEEFVKDFCEKLGVELTVISRDIPTIAKETGESEEAAGRRVRYGIFREKLEDLGGGVIATAHHKNDSAETILFNLARGSGLEGVTGITPCGRGIIRPLLCLTRDEIEEFINENNLEFVTDSTNADTKYTRNFIRHEIITPMTERVNKNFVEHVCNFSDIARRYKDFVDGEADRILGKPQNGFYKFKKDELAGLPDILLETVILKAYQALSPDSLDISAERIRAVAKGIKAPFTGSKTYELPKGVGVRAASDEIKFFVGDEDPAPQSPALYFMDDKVRGRLNRGERVELTYGHYRISLFLAENFIKNGDGDYTKYFNYDKITSNVCIRKRQPKDTIIIDNKGSDKKLKKEFIDRKIPEDFRSECLIFADGNHCLWAVGVRQSVDTFADKDSTVLEVTVKEEI